MYRHVELNMYRHVDDPATWRRSARRVRFSRRSRTSGSWTRQGSFQSTFYRPVDDSPVPLVSPFHRAASRPFFLFISPQLKSSLVFTRLVFIRSPTNMKKRVFPLGVGSGPLLVDPLFELELDPSSSGLLPLPMGGTNELTWWGCCC